MGRLPATFAGMPVMFRVPFIMQTTKSLTASQSGIAFPEGPVTNGIDKPFEVHRMIPRVTALDGATPPVVVGVQPDEDSLSSLVSITIRDFGKNQALTKAPTRLANFVKGAGERTWEFAEPYYLLQGDGFEITGKSLAYPAGLNTTSIQVTISFEGFLLVLAPPTDRR